MVLVAPQRRQPDLYCTLRTAGVADSQLLLHSLYVICPAATFLTVGAVLASSTPAAAPEDGKKGQ